MVLGHTAAEFAETEDQDPFGKARRGQIVAERLQRAGKFREQAEMGPGLRGVGVVPGLLRIEDAGGEPPFIWRAISLSQPPRAVEG
jgi:hypothetical protein